MAVTGVPLWLPDWDDAATAVGELDVASLRMTARALVDLVFTDDTGCLDALPSQLEAAIVTPLSVLSATLDGGTDVEVVVASRLVRRSIDPLLADAPEELKAIVEFLPRPVDAR